MQILSYMNSAIYCVILHHTGQLVSSISYALGYSLQPDVHFNTFAMLWCSPTTAKRSRRKC